jgi:hypothetical protein
VQFQQRGSAGGHQGGEFFLDRFDLLIDGLQLTDQLGGETAAGLAGQVPRPYRGEHRSGLLRGRERLRPAGEQLQQQAVQPVDRLGAGSAQFVEAVSEHAHHDQVIVYLDLDQAGAAQRDHGHRVGVDRVGFAAVARGEDPHLGGQLRRHIDHRLAVVHQAVREVLADSIAALNRPQAAAELPARGEHLRIVDLVRAEPATRQHRGPLVHHLDGGRSLMRVHADITPTCFICLLHPVMSGKEGTATSSWANPFRASPRTVPGETAGQMRATPMTLAGSRNERASHRAPGPSLARHRSWTKSLSSRERRSWFDRLSGRALVDP